MNLTHFNTSINFGIGYETDEFEFNAKVWIRRYVY